MKVDVYGYGVGLRWPFRSAVQPWNVIAFLIVPLSSPGSKWKPDCQLSSARQLTTRTS